MIVEQEIVSETEFLEQVSYWLPPRVSKKDEWLQELGQDLRAAYKDFSPEIPVNERWKGVFAEFGTPQKVAKDLISSQADSFIRVGFLRRALAYLIDIAFCFSLTLLILVVGGLGLYLIGIPDVLTVQIFLTLFLLIGLIIATFGYFVILERNWGTTLGKRLRGIQVVSETGLRLTWQQAGIRNLSKFNLPLLPLHVLAMLLYVVGLFVFLPFGWLLAWIPEIRLQNSNEIAVGLMTTSFLLFDWLFSFLLIDWLVGRVLKTHCQRGLDMIAKTQVIEAF
jgi:uncharacterized RDD family membrane protein YckC